MKEIVNANFYIPRGGIPWRVMPSHFPLWRTVYR
jgi:transposase